MISDILRVLLERILFRTVTKEQEAKQSVSKDCSVIKDKTRRRKKFCVRPIMAETYEGNVFLLEKIFVKFAIGFSILSIAGIFYLWFFDNTVYYTSELKYIEMVRQEGVIVITLLFIWIVAGCIKLLRKYMERTKYIFEQSRIYIQVFGKKEKVIDYEELGEYITQKKIKVCNGRFEFRYKGGMIPVYTWGDKPTPSEFYQFINEQCGTNIPEISKVDNEVVRKTGIGRIWHIYFALPLFGIAIWLGIICALDEFEIGQGIMKMVMDFIHFLFHFGNIFGIIGLVCVLIGIVQKIRYYFPAKKHFAKYKDIIKVSLF